MIFLYIRSLGYDNRDKWSGSFTGMVHHEFKASSLDCNLRRPTRCTCPYTHTQTHTHTHTYIFSLPPLMSIYALSGIIVHIMLKK